MNRVIATVGAAIILGGAHVTLADHVHATWTANPASIREGEQTRFTLTLTSSPNTGLFQATSFAFNAGTSMASPATGSLSLTGNTSSPATLFVDTTYYQDGSYNASLKGSGQVLKKAGKKDTYFGYTVDLSTRVNVANVAPTINLASLSFAPLITEGTAFTFNATATDPGLYDALVYQWDFNSDGIWDATGQNPTFTFAEVGQYTGRVRVSDDDSFTLADFSTRVIAAPQLEIDPPAVAVPLPGAVWGGLALFGAIGLVRGMRKHGE
jgi:hypothetical protein